MLVLSQRVGDKIMIGDDIVLLVTEFRGDKVRIGIDAPPEVVVDREAVWRAKQGLPPLPKPEPKPKPEKPVQAVEPQSKPPLGQHFHRRMKANLASGRAASGAQENPAG